MDKLTAQDPATVHIIIIMITIDPNKHSLTHAHSSVAACSFMHLVTDLDSVIFSLYYKLKQNTFHISYIASTVDCIYPLAKYYCVSYILTDAWINSHYTRINTAQL